MISVSLVFAALFFAFPSNQTILEPTATKIWARLRVNRVAAAVRYVWSYLPNFISRFSLSSKIANEIIFLSIDFLFAKQHGSWPILLTGIGTGSALEPEWLVKVTSKFRINVMTMILRDWIGGSVSVGWYRGMIFPQSKWKVNEWRI